MIPLVVLPRQTGRWNMNNWSLAHFRRKVRVERFLKEVGIFLEKGRTLFGKRSASFFRTVFEQHSNAVSFIISDHTENYSSPWRKQK